jgi:hypothetical protein
MLNPSSEKYSGLTPQDDSDERVAESQKSIDRNKFGVSLSNIESNISEEASVSVGSPMTLKSGSPEVAFARIIICLLPITNFAIIIL